MADQGTTCQIVAMDGTIIPILGTSTARWTFREGTSPVIETFDVPAKSSGKLYAAQGPVKLMLQSSIKGRLQTIENLYIIDAAPGDNPFVWKVRLADRRYWWQYAFVWRHFNIKRRVGTRTVQRPDSAGFGEQQLQDVFSDFWYASWSLKDPLLAIPEGKWEAKDAILAVIEDARAKEIELLESIGFVGVNPGADWDENIDPEHLMPIEDLHIRDSGGAAVSRAMDMAPRAGLWVDGAGRIKVYSKTDGGELAVLKALGYVSERSSAEYVGEGHVQLIRKRAIRPKSVVVHFVREVELRFDFLEIRDVTATRTGAATRRVCANVLPLPDNSLNIGGNFTPQGTWVNIDDVLVAWGSPPGMGRALNHADLQRAMVPFLDFMGALLATGAFAPDVDWSARIGALQAHWRRTMRINPIWTDRIMSMRPYRVATTDQVGGQRAPAVCYSDHFLLGSQRWHWIQSKLGEPLTFGVNVAGYPAGDPFTSLSGTTVASMTAASKPSPGDVAIVDADQGIIRMEYRVDPIRRFDTVLPSLMENMAGAKLFGGGIQPVTFDSFIDAHKFPTLSGNHKMAFIFTAIPGSPNDKRSLHKIEVKPGDVLDLVPVAMRAGLADAAGPSWDSFVGPGYEVARVGWSDERADDIERVFGFGDGEADLTGLVVNDKPGSILQTGASLSDIARAVAARVWSGFADHFEGSATFGFARDDGKAKLAGWIDSISHEIRAGSAMGATTLTLPDKLPDLNLVSFLDSSTRAIILRQVQPNAST